MTRDEMDSEIAKIESTAKDAKNAIYAKFASDLRQFEVGDIITNGTTIIKITKIGWGKFLSEPYPVYKGDVLTKKLEPVKKGDPTTHLYSNLTLIKKKES